MNRIFPGDYVIVKSNRLEVSIKRDGKREVIKPGDVLRVLSIQRDGIVYKYDERYNHSFPLDEVQLTYSTEMREIHLGDRVLVTTNNVGASVSVGEVVTVLSFKRLEYKDNATLGELIWFRPTDPNCQLHYLPLKDVKFVGVDINWHRDNLKDNEVRFLWQELINHDSISRAG